MANLKINTRDAARKAGVKRYFTGRPCARGHVSERYVTGACVECDTITRREWRISNKSKLAKKTAQWRVQNPDKHAAYMKRASAKIRVTGRRANWRRKGYPEPTRPMPANCELCGRIQAKERALHLDHDHVTGVFRGWLCYACNSGLGKLGDNEAGLLKALAYLRTVNRVT